MSMRLNICVMVLFLASMAFSQENDSLPPPTDVYKAGEGIVVSVPLDSLSILNGSYSIDLDGYVQLPVLGRYFLLGKSEHQIEDFLSTSMAQYMRDTHVLVKPAIRITFLGNWQRPGMHYVDPQAPIWEVCREVGGPASEVNLRKWKVMRGNKTLDVSVLDQFSHGTSLQYAGIKSGDIFVIPTPDPQQGVWYWTRETLSVTTEVATVLSAVVTSVLTYMILERTH